MFTIPAKYTDGVNIAFIILTCLLSHLFPYHLFLFSYAVLGPAHYLTQISWMHDRRYFAESALLAPAMWVLSFLVILLIASSNEHTMLAQGVILSVSVGLALFFILPNDKMVRRLGIAAGVSLCALAACWPSLSLFIAAFLPTILHVFVFTAAFMWLGAMKTRKKSAYASLVILLLCAATFFIPVADTTVAPDLEGVRLFKPAVAFIQKLLGISSVAETQLFGFLSFAYTYHYLNWFSKAEIIHWNKIPRRRVGAIILIYVFTLSVYAYDYTLGFLLIVLLSLAHVLLELPLNLRTFAALARR